MSEIQSDFLPEEVKSLNPAVRIFNKHDPRSLINICWPDMQAILEVIAEDFQDELKLSERELKKKLTPDPTLCRLRLRFWDEYSRAQDRGKRMKLAEIYTGVCSEDYWERNIQKDPWRVLWIITPPVDYMVTMQELLYLGLDEIREVLELPIRDRKGHINTKLIGEKVKIVQMLELRVKGAVIQKVAIKQQIDQKVQHLQDPLLNAGADDIDALDAQIKLVTKQISRIQKKENLLEAAPIEAEAVILTGSAEEVIESLERDGVLDS